MTSQTARTANTAQRVSWCFTAYEELKLAEDEIAYLVCQVEICPTTKKEHIQGYVRFKRSQRMSGAKRILGLKSVHVTPANGTEDENYAYCTKADSRKDPDAEPFEFGTRKKTKGEEKSKSGQGARNDLSEFKEWIKNYPNEKIPEIELLENFPGIFARYKQFIKDACRIYKKRLVTDDDLVKEACMLHFITGETGTGKTTWVLKNIKDIYEKDGNSNWWDGYEGEENVLINEWYTKDYMNVQQLIKHSDIINKKIQVKGGYTRLTCKNIYITTNHDPETILAEVGDDHVGAFLRRSKWYIMKNWELTETAAPASSDKGAARELLKSLGCK